MIFFHSVYEKYNHMAETMQQYIETNLQQKDSCKSIKLETASVADQSAFYV